MTESQIVVVEGQIAKISAILIKISAKSAKTMTIWKEFRRNWYCFRTRNAIIFIKKYSLYSQWFEVSSHLISWRISIITKKKGARKKHRHNWSIDYCLCHLGENERNTLNERCLSVRKLWRGSNRLRHSYLKGTSNLDMITNAVAFTIEL